MYWPPRSPDLSKLYFFLGGRGLYGGQIVLHKRNVISEPTAAGTKDMVQNTGPMHAGLKFK